jgi:hypothetical protein
MIFIPDEPENCHYLLKFVSVTYNKSMNYCIKSQNRTVFEWYKSNIIWKNPYLHTLIKPKGRLKIVKS